MSARDELFQIIWDGAVDDRVKAGKSPEQVPVVRPKVWALVHTILAAGYRKPRRAVMFSDEAVERAAEASYYSTLDPDDEDAPSWEGLKAANSEYPEIWRAQVRAVIAALKGDA